MIENVVFLETLTPQLTQYCTTKIKEELEGKTITFSLQECHAPGELEGTAEDRLEDDYAYQQIININVLALAPLSSNDFESPDEIDNLNEHLSDDFTKFSLVSSVIQYDLEEGYCEDGEKTNTQAFTVPYILVLFKEDTDDNWFFYSLGDIRDVPKIEGFPVSLNDDKIIEKLNSIFD